jgi:hypothetical protein
VENGSATLVEIVLETPIERPDVLETLMLNAAIAQRAKLASIDRMDV